MLGCLSELSHVGLLDRTEKRVPGCRQTRSAQCVDHHVGTLVPGHGPERAEVQWALPWSRDRRPAIVEGDTVGNQVHRNRWSVAAAEIIGHKRRRGDECVGLGDRIAEEVRA